MTEDDRRRLAYEAAGSDAEAARLLGLQRNTFREWRNRRGLPPKHPPGRIASIEERVKVYEQTKSDGEAARRLGISRSSFAQWRRAKGLQPKANPPIRTVTEELLRAAYRVSSSDFDAAKQLGIATDVFLKWRLTAGLDPPSAVHRDLRRIPSNEEDFRYRTYLESEDDETAANKIGISRAAFRDWRMRQGLSAYRDGTSLGDRLEEERVRYGEAMHTIREIVDDFLGEKTLRESKEEGWVLAMEKSVAIIQMHSLTNCHLNHECAKEIEAELKKWGDPP